MNINYRVVILLVLAFVASVIPTKVIYRDSRFEEGLLKMLDKCTKGEVDSLPIPLPSLKRIGVPHIDMNISGFAVSTSDIYITGLELISVKTLTASESNLSILIEFVVPKIKIHADWYRLMGRILGLYTINDKGPLNAQVDNLSVKADVRFGSRGNDTVINNLDLNYSFGDVEVSLGDSNFITNRVVNSKIGDIVNSDDFKRNVKDAVITTSQRYLQGHTPQEFRKIISNF